MSLGGIVLILFGNQSLVTDSVMHIKAQEIADEMLYTSSLIAQKDFKLLNPLPTSIDEMYNKNLGVEYTQYFQKKVTARVSWQNEYRAEQHVTLTKIFSDPENSSSGDTCDSFSPTEWKHPEITNSTTQFSELIRDTQNTYSISDIEIHKNTLYVTAKNTSRNNKENLFIFDATNPNNPNLIGKIDNSPTNSAGLSSLAIASSSTGVYAFTTNAISSNFSICNPGKNCAQLQIFNVTNPKNPSLITNFLLPTSTEPRITGSGGRATGQSIFYTHGYIYLGLTKTTTGPEFNIIDVHNPEHPEWLGGIRLGTTVHSITVHGNYAYITHKADNSSSPEEQLTIVDVRDPQNPRRTGGFWKTGGILNAGKSIAVQGDTVYLGRLASKISGIMDTIPEFYILSATSDGKISTPVLGSIPLPTPESVHDFIIQNTHAFFVTTSEFQVWNIASSSNIHHVSSIPLPHGGIDTPQIDCEKNYMYASSNNEYGQGFISIITDSP